MSIFFTKFYPFLSLFLILNMIIDDEIIFFCLNHNFQAKYMIRCKIATSQWNDFTLCTKTYSVCTNSIIKLFIHCFEREFSKQRKKTLWLFFMDEVQSSQGYRATTKRQFTFYHSVPRSSWYSLNRFHENERQSWLCSHPMVLNSESLDWESSPLSTTSLHQMLSKQTDYLYYAIYFTKWMAWFSSI